MDMIDNATITRVWQRVHPAEAPANPLTINDILYQEQQIAATYTFLLRRGNRPIKPLLNILYSQKRTTIACIKGFYALQGQKPPHPHAIRPYHTTTEAALRQCYAQQLQCIQLYKEYRSHPELGQIFRQLETQGLQHCQNLLQLLGSIS